MYNSIVVVVVWIDKMLIVYQAVELDCGTDEQLLIAYELLRIIYLLTFYSNDGNILFC